MQSARNSLMVLCLHDIFIRRAKKYKIIFIDYIMSLLIITPSSICGTFNFHIGVDFYFVDKLSFKINHFLTKHNVYELWSSQLWEHHFLTWWWLLPGSQTSSYYRPLSVLLWLWRLNSDKMKWFCIQHVSFVWLRTTVVASSVSQYRVLNFKEVMTVCFANFSDLFFQSCWRSANWRLEFNLPKSHTACTPIIMFSYQDLCPLSAWVHMYKMFDTFMWRTVVRWLCQS